MNNIENMAWEALEAAKKGQYFDVLSLLHGLSSDLTPKQATDLRAGLVGSFTVWTGAAILGIRLDAKHVARTITQEYLNCKAS